MADHGQHSKRDDDLLADAIPIPPQDVDELEPIDFDDGDDDLKPEADDDSSANQIRAFGAQKRAMSRWKQQPIASGAGARHVRTFVAKLRLDAIDHLDEQINEWLDEHPDFDVKFVTTTIGMLVGKNTEEALFVNVWV